LPDYTPFSYLVKPEEDGSGTHQVEQWGFNRNVVRHDTLHLTNMFFLVVPLDSLSSQFIRFLSTPYFIDPSGTSPQRGSYVGVVGHVVQEFTRRPSGGHGESSEANDPLTLNR